MTRRAKRAGEGERSWSLYSTLPSSDSGTRRGIEGEERSEESGEGVCERVDVPHDEGFGEGGREMRVSHGLGRCLRLFKQCSQVSRLIQGPC